MDCSGLCACSDTDRMQKLIVILFIACISVNALAQAPPKPATPVLSDTEKLTIRSAQVEALQAQRNQDSLNGQCTQENFVRTDAALQAAKKKLEDAIGVIFKSHNLSREEYDLQPDLTLVAKPKADTAKIR